MSYKMPTESKKKKMIIKSGKLKRNARVRMLKIQYHAPANVVLNTAPNPLKYFIHYLHVDILTQYIITDIPIFCIILSL